MRNSSRPGSLARTPACACRGAPTRPLLLVLPALPSTARAARPGPPRSCGVEVPQALVWSRWEPGGEYVKAITVKNVSTRVISVVHKMNHSKAFCLDFPAPAKLSPGMSVALRVVFRPLRAQAYQDTVTLLCDGAPLLVPLSAPLAAPRLQAPPGVDFGLVPAHERFERPLPIRNVGEAPLTFSWRSEAPFSVTPASGRLAPGEAAACRAAFVPGEAAAFEGTAACELDSGEVVVVKLAGAAKFPYLCLDAPRLDLGSVVVGRAAAAQVRVGNHSPVEARFRIEAAPTAAGGGGAEEEEGVFSVEPREGVLAPGEFGVLTVTYEPRTSGAPSFQRWLVSTPGGNRAPLQARGAAEGPWLALSARALDFGSVPVGAAPSKVVYIKNASEVAAAYEFRDDGGGVFLLGQPRGVVPPRSVGHTRVAFAPGAPANYWRRLVCIVKDAEPISLDVLGTAFDDKSRPPPLTYAHVCAYLARTAAGGGPLPPDSAGGADTEGGGLGAWAAEAAAAAAEAEAAIEAGGCRSQLPQHLASLPCDGGADETAAAAPAVVGPDAWQLLFEGQDPAGALQLSEASLDFGACSRLLAPEPRAVVVTNRTGAKLSVVACVPAWQDPSAPPPAGAPRSPSPQRGASGSSGHALAQQSGRFAGSLVGGGGSAGSGGSGGGVGAQGVFHVFPAALELRPGASGVLKVAFRPPKDGQHYCASIQIVGAVKAQRNFRLVADDRVLPPWTCALQVYGNTFSGPFSPEFGPKARLAAPAVAFPPLRPGQAGHQTAAILNYGDTPVAFEFATHGLPPSLRLQPAAGVVPPKSHALIALRYAPPAAPAALDVAVPLTFNRSPADTATLAVRGGAHEPALATSLAPGNRLFLRPTCVGAASARAVEVVNAGRVAAGWRWAVSRKLEGVVAVEPQCGVLLGGESCQVTVTFVPRAVQAYEARTALLLVTPEQAAAAAAGSADGAARGGSPGCADAASGSGDGGGSAGGGAAAGREGLEVAVITVSGEGTPGALSVEPPGGVDFGALRVGYAERRALTFVNQSDGLLRFRAVLVEDGGGGGSGGDDEGDEGAVGEAEAGVQGGGGGGGSLEAEMAAATAGADAAAEPVVFDDAAAAAGPAAGGSHGSGGDGSGAADCWLDAAEGEVGGRSQKTVVLTLLPRRRRRYRLRLLVLPAAGGGGGPPGAGAAAAAAPLASVAVRADARFPCVLVTDVACDGMSKQVAWQQLAIPALNAALAAPVAPPELRVRALADRGVLTTDSAAAMLPPLALDLGALAAGGPGRVFAVRLTNPGPLAAAWELHSYDDPELELENWVEGSKPLTPAEAHRALILRRRIVEAHPHSGRLAPGASVDLRLRAAPAAEGEWGLPLFLRVADGRQLHLSLRVRVVPPAAQLPLLLPAAADFHLAPAPIGEAEPPLQTHALRNGGPAPLEYALDAAPLAGLARGSWGFGVLRYAGGAPLRGVIPPGGAAVFNWAFQPLEAKSYSATLPLTLGGGGGGVVALRLTGRGYHPRQEAAEDGETEGEAARRWRRWLGFRISPALSPPWRPLLVSPEVLSLGPCLQQGAARRLLRLQNTGPVALAFRFELGAFEGARGAVAGGLVLRPDASVVAPGGVLVCQAVFTAGPRAQVFEAEVRCVAWAAEEGGDDGDGGDDCRRRDCGSAEAEQQQQRQQHMGPLLGDSTAAAASLWGEERRGRVGGSEGRDGGDDDEEAAEEIIAQHPDRPPRRAHGTVDARLARSRLPLHESMTAAALGKSGALRARFEESLRLRRPSPPRGPRGGGAAAAHGRHGEGEGEGCGGRPEAAGFKQVTVLTLCGAVLSREHAAAGSYVAPEERAEAAKLAAEDLLLEASAAAEPLPPAPLQPRPAGGGAAEAEARAGGGDPSGWPAAGECSGDGGGGGAHVCGEALAAAAEVLHDLVAEAWADGAAAAAAAATDAAAAGAVGAGGGAAAGPGAVAFAEYVLDSALVGALQDAAAGGVLEGGGGDGKGQGRGRTAAAAAAAAAAGSLASAATAVRHRPLLGVAGVALLLLLSRALLGWPLGAAHHPAAVDLRDFAPLGVPPGDGGGGGGGDGGWRETAARYRFTVITGASSNYMRGLTNLVGSVHFWCPKCRLAIYNLGLSEAEIKAARDSWCNVEVEWADTLKKQDLMKYAWKPQAILEAVEKFGVVFWVDGGSTITGPLDDIERDLRRDGIYAVQGQDDGMARLTHKDAFKYFGFNSKDQFKNRPSFAGNTWGWVKGSPWVEAVLRPWERCSLVEACISPNGSSLGNHRYDQSVVSIILYTNATVYNPDGSLLSDRICPGGPCKRPAGAAAAASSLVVTHHTDRLAANAGHLNNSGCFVPSHKFVWTSRQACDCYLPWTTNCTGVPPRHGARRLRAAAAP
ncbi:MAG: hypothetical protein J3K34DRAFT_516186 [Monoraphidium minutum]|nr:MAG: hypothetical protein J3K34DRAFT_516186 [Monoraphidium minutum]